MIPLKDNIPTTRFPIVTVVLIAINVAFFVWQLSASGESGSATAPALERAGASERDQLNFEYGAIPAEVLHPGEYCAPTDVEHGEIVDIVRRAGRDRARVGTRAGAVVGDAADLDVHARRHPPHRR